MTPPQEWSAAALFLLDSLWALDIRPGVMQRRLAPLLGFAPSTQDIREMASRHRDKPVEHAVPTSVSEEPARFPLWEAKPPRKDNPVRRVKPGSCPVPKGGYRLGQSR